MQAESEKVPGRWWRGLRGRLWLQGRGRWTEVDLLTIVLVHFAGRAWASTGTVMKRAPGTAIAPRKGTVMNSRTVTSCIPSVTGVCPGRISLPTNCRPSSKMSTDDQASVKFNLFYLFVNLIITTSFIRVSMNVHKCNCEMQERRFFVDSPTNWTRNIL